MSWNQAFVDQVMLNQLNDNVEYPVFQDIQIYNIKYTIEKS